MQTTQDGDRQEQDRIESGIQRWRHEFPDIDSSGKAVVGRILHLQEIFLITINGALEPFGLKYPEFAVLATLRVQGQPYRMSPKALLDSLILTSGGLSNLLRKLEKRGLIRRSQDAVDRRGVVVELTALGRKRVEPAMRLHAQTELSLVRSLTARERRHSADAMSKLIKTIERGPRPRADVQPQLPR